MAHSVRHHRVDAWEPLPAPAAARAPHPPASLAARTAAAGRLDLGSRIALAADIGAAAGNRAMAHVAGFARTDHRTQPPTGVTEIGAASHSPGNRGYTQSRYTANPPVFRIGRTEQVNGQWTVHVPDVRLPALDYDVWWPAPGRHRLGDYGRGSHFLDVTEDWSNRIRDGENEHVDDTDRAYSMTWGRIAGIINAMAAGDGYTGPTTDDARAAAWRAFRSRLPVALRPEGDTPTTEAQEAKWGADDGTIFRRMMNETKRARDNSGWHTPDERLKASEGDDRVDELAVGGSRIGQVPSERLIQEAWERITRV